MIYNYAEYNRAEAEVVRNAFGRGYENTPYIGHWKRGLCRNSFDKEIFFVIQIARPLYKWNIWGVIFQ